MDFYEIAGAVTVALSLIGGAGYIWDVLRGETKPHMFSWLVWALVQGIGAAVAFVGGAMVSSITMCVGSLICLSIAGLSVRFGEKNITKSDWALFLSALAIIPVWIMTKEPLVAAALVTLIDVLGACPTLRKSWEKPQEENLRAFTLYTIASAAGVLAITPFTLVTGLYPIALLAMNAGQTLMLIIRRRTLSPAHAA